MLITESPEFSDELISDYFVEEIKGENQIYLEFNKIWVHKVARNS